MPISEGFHWRNKPPLGSLLDLSHPLARGQVARWALFEGAGGQLWDLTGNGLAATSGTTGSVLPAWGTGTRGTALHFDGGTSYASFPGTNTLLQSAKFTIHARLLLFGTAGVQVSVANFAETTGPTTDYGWALYTNAGAFAVNTYQGTSAAVTASGGSASANTIYSQTATHDGTTLTLYVNGLQVAQTAGASPPYLAGTMAGRLGCLYNTASGLPSLFLNGWLEGVTLYNRALTPAEVMWRHEEEWADILTPTTRRYFPLAGGAPPFCAGLMQFSQP